MLKEKLNPYLKSAMKQKESLKLTALRSIKSYIINKEKEVRKTNLTPVEEIQVLTKLEKESLQSIADFKKGNRQDLVDSEEAILKVIQSFLPEKMSEVYISQELVSIIEENNYSTIRDMGKVIKSFNDKHPGKANGKLLANLAKQCLI